MIRIVLAFFVLALTSLVVRAEPAAYVSFTFDDAPDSVLEVGLPLLEKYHIPATLYISTRNMTRPGYMDCDAIKEAINGHGWELGAHTHTHARLTTLTDAEIEGEIEVSKEEFAKCGFSEPKHFASPFGAYDDRVLKILMSHYESHRTAWPIGKNTLEPDLSRLASYYLVKNTTMEEIVKVLDDLQLTGGWVILQMHHVFPKGSQVTEEYGTTLLEDIIEEVHARGLTTLTVGETLKQLQKPIVGGT